ncbi:uncharacterized protein DS421_1g13950 [Arachis hypogaea]|nr:uncharacterized protein DS421_1g13950 [Arachis hypogaea]
MQIARPSSLISTLISLPSSTTPDSSSPAISSHIGSIIPRQRSPLASSLQRCSCRLLISVFGALHHWCRRSDLVESRSSSPSLQPPSLSLLQRRRL